MEKGVKGSDCSQIQIVILEYAWMVWEKLRKIEFRVARLRNAI
jgi:hypothetical protein